MSSETDPPDSDGDSGIDDKTIRLTLAVSSVVFVLLGVAYFVNYALGGYVDGGLTALAAILSVGGVVMGLATLLSYRYDDSDDESDETDPLEPHSAGDEPPTDDFYDDGSDSDDLESDDSDAFIDMSGDDDADSDKEDDLGFDVSVDETDSESVDIDEFPERAVEQTDVEESDEDDSQETRLQQATRVGRESVERFAQWARDEDWASHWDTVRSPVAHVVALAVTGVVTYLVLEWMWAALGPIETIAAVVVFVVSAISIPVGVMLFGPSFFGPLKSIFGKMHWFTGHLAWGYTYLVETDNGWTLCPGRETQYYLDGNWEDIDHGQGNHTVVLGLPFGIIRHKGDDTYDDLTRDGIAGTSTRTDGGAVANGSSTTKDRSGSETNSGSGVSQRTRAGIQEVSPDLSGDDTLQIDLVRVASGGLLQVGDAELIERAEYDELESIASGSRLDGFLPILAMLFGIIFGSVMGLLMTGAF